MHSTLKKLAATKYNQHMRLVAIALGFIFGAMLSTSFALAWTGPTGSPPSNNASAPINVSSTGQVKAGNLGVTGYLNFGSTLGTSGYGIWDNNGTLEFKNSGGSWASIQSTVSSLVNTNNPSYSTSVTSPKYCIGSSCITTWPSGGSELTGSGSGGYDARWTGGMSLGNSSIQDDGNGNISVGGNVYVGARGMYMSKTARTTAGNFGNRRFTLITVVVWSLRSQFCPSGSVMVGLYTYNQFLCQWIN